MRISDQQMYRQATNRIMSAVTEQATAAEQVSSGLRVAHPWDDAGDAAMISLQSQEANRQKTIATVATRAGDELTSVDNALTQVTTSLTRAHELAVQLGSDTYSAADRANGAVQIQQLMATVVAQLNVKSGDRYVFGGTRDGAPPFDAAGVYTGDANVRQVEIAPGVLEDASIRADQAFKGAGGGIDVLTELTSLATALQTNNAPQIRASIQTLGDGLSQVSHFQSRVGGMQNVFDVATTTATSFSNAAADAQTKLEDVDIIPASTRLAAAQTALQASMSAATQQFKLSILNYL